MFDLEPEILGPLFFGVILPITLAIIFIAARWIYVRVAETLSMFDGWE